MGVGVDGCMCKWVWVYMSVCVAEMLGGWVGGGYNAVSTCYHSSGKPQRGNVQRKQCSDLPLFNTSVDVGIACASPLPSSLHYNRWTAEQSINGWRKPVSHEQSTEVRVHRYSLSLCCCCVQVAARRTSHAGHDGLDGRQGIHLRSYLPYRQGESTPMVTPSLPPRWVYSYGHTFLTTKVSLHLWLHLPYHQGESTPTLVPSLPPGWVYTYGFTFFTIKLGLHLRLYLPYHQGECTPTVVPYLPPCWVYTHSSVVPSLPPRWVSTYGHTFLTTKVSLHLWSHLPYHQGESTPTTKMSLHLRSHLPYYQGESAPTVAPSLPPRWVYTYGCTFRTTKVSPGVSAIPVVAIPSLLPWWGCTSVLYLW